MMMHKETAEAFLEAIFSKEEINACKYDTHGIPQIDTEAPRYCCICGGRIEGYGNSPWPIVNDPDETCCDLCNVMEVIPARLSQLRGRENRSLSSDY